MLDYWAERLGLNKISDEIYGKKRVNLIREIHNLASSSPSVFEISIKKLLKENYPGLSTFISQVNIAREAGDLRGIENAKIAFGTLNTTKVQQFIDFSNHVHRHYCKHSSEDACTYCDGRQLPSLEYYEGQSLQESLDAADFCEDLNSNSPQELETLKVLKAKSLKKREKKLYN